MLQRLSRSYRHGGRNLIGIKRLKQEGLIAQGIDRSQPRPVGFGDCLVVFRIKNRLVRPSIYMRTGYTYM
jgi:hypothetical protein